MSAYIVSVVLALCIGVLDWRIRRLEKHTGLDRTLRRRRLYDEHTRERRQLEERIRRD